MPSESSSPVQYIVVPCPTCGTRVDERVRDQPRQVPCPDCHGDVRIPGRGELPPPEAPRPPEDPGVYGLRTEAPSGPKPRAPAAPIVLVICPICSARLHPKLRKSSYRLQCPDCHEAIRVPGAGEAAAREPPQPASPPPRAPETTGTLTIPSLPERKPVHAFFAEQGAQIHRELLDPPPEWVWFSDVWTIPWDPGVIKKWAYISLGLSSFGVLLALLTSMFGAAGSPASLVMAFLALPMIWIFLWTASYTTSTCMHIIAETSAGARRLRDWPEQGWREGLFAFLPILFLFAVAALLGHVVGLAAAAAGWSYWRFHLETIIALGPYLVLSMLETGAWYQPFSWPVTASIGRNVLDWLTAYLLLALILRGWAWLWSHGVAASPYLMLIGTGWIWAAALLIAARVLGRLAWKITRPVPAGADEQPG